MYKQDSVHQVLLDYKITITGSKFQKQYDATPVNSQWDQYMDYSVIPYRDVKMITAEIPEDTLIAMADTLCEFRDLMKDPETARLLMEARFINRLKGNR
jgi:hypothetical protein